MKLTKARQQQIDEAYDTLIQVCLYDRPLKDMEPHLADDVMNFGAGKKEVTKTKAAFLKQIKGQKKLAAGLKMDFKIKPVLRKIINKGDVAIYTDDIANTVWINGVKNKLIFRLSFIFEYRNKKWILVHSHTSAPDSQRTDDEIWPVEELKKRTAVLEKSLDEKIAELEIKNRELEIEASLEKVRAIALSMKAPQDMPEVCKTISLQLQSLGMKEIRNVQTAIFYESRGIYMNYEYYARHHKTFITETVYTNHEVPKAFAAKMLKGKGEFYITHIKGKNVREWLAYQKTTNVFIDHFLEKARSLNYYWYSLGAVALGISTYAPLGKGEIKLFKRFLNVFELAYTKYLDIEQAIGQAREAKIESSLEKVRSRSLAMHNSEELKEVVAIVFDKLRELNLHADGGAGIAILNDETKGIDYWAANPDYISASHFTTPYFDHIFNNDIWKARENGINFINNTYSFEQKNSFWDYLIEHTDFKNLPEGNKIMIYESKSMTNAFALSKHSAIGVVTYLGKTFSGEQIDIVKRFAKVFEQAYIRFLDLQKAEAQAREAQIEAALERVRSRSMGMQKSDELREVIQVVFQQLQQLNFNIDSANFFMNYKESNDFNLWIARPGQAYPAQIYFPYIDHPYFNYFIETKEKGLYFTAYTLTFEEKNSLWEHFFKYAPVPEDRKKHLLSSEGYAASVVYMNSFALAVNNYAGILFSEAQNAIVMRFAKVFEQSFTRFLDLQKAEVQAREGQIEAALERVRSRTMGMQKSEELKEVIQAVYDQFVHLNIHVEHTGFIMDYKARDDMHIWLADKHAVPFQITIPYFDSPHWNGFNEAKEKGIDFFANQLSFEEKNKFYQDLFKLIPGVPEETLEYYFSCPGLAISTVLLDNVGLYIENFSGIPYTDEENNTLMRFGKVFQQTYTRFLDLQKAEAQAKEAQIEAALERVRSRTMAMQNSDELAELVATLFTELNRLEFALTSCIIWINNPELLTAEMWVASTEMNKPPEPYYIKPFRHPYFKSVINAFKEKNKKWVYEMKSEEKKFFQQAFFNEVGSFPTLIKHALEAPESVIYSASFFNFGAVEIIGTEKITDEKFEILHRLGKVFDMSYTRFNDLKQAEAQAQEAKIEAALERVRSRTLAMQKSDELAETVAVVFRQLIDLGIAPNRLYIAIMKNVTGNAEFWITDEDGSRISSGFNANLNDNRSFLKMFEGWKEQKKSIIIDMQEKELAEYFRHLSVDLKVPFQSGLSQQGRVQSIAYFSKGFIGIASPEPQPDATVNLLERFAGVFNLTYTRFNDLEFAEYQAEQARLDLVKLQTEKKRAEEALTELKATQNQLIQSEKMASLGELTAGIAHEIQNPLNFVNNFSEVSTELVDEMYTEIEQGNFEDVRQIAEDLKQNLEKINHHGKRASDIVKGMLQHSRSSSATKESTDINNLADEYLRLAYHGLRAKDNTFSAIMKTDYDETIGNINIIPQDIGRVILNLITNAFYVVTEKKKSGIRNYEPTVSVSTKRTDNMIMLSVKDNGSGIPQKVLDKIFQPFFTTKPTGQGTGLGLSLSYDIMKAQGGDIKVETKEGEGTEFIIQLPVV